MMMITIAFNSALNFKFPVLRPEKAKPIAAQKILVAFPYSSGNKIADNMTRAPIENIHLFLILYPRIVILIRILYLTKN